MKPKITITTQTYFENVFYYFGWALLIFAVPIAIQLWYVGIIAGLLGLMLTSTAYKLVIDPKTKKIEDYLVFLGMKKNSAQTAYQNLQNISIKSGTYTQQLNYKSVSSTVQGTIYSAYLLADEQNHFLGESKSKKNISEKASRIAKKLKIDFVEL